MYLALCPCAVLPQVAFTLVPKSSGGDEEGVMESITDQFRYAIDEALIEEYGVGYLEPSVMEQAVANTYVMYKIPPWVDKIKKQPPQ